MHGYIVCLRFMYTLLLSHSVIVCFVVFSFLWYLLVRSTVDRLFHTTFITSTVLIWAFLMFNHFNKNVIPRSKRKRTEILDDDGKTYFSDVFYAMCFWLSSLSSSLLHAYEKSNMRKLPSRIVSESSRTVVWIILIIKT